MPTGITTLLSLAGGYPTKYKAGASRHQRKGKSAKYNFGRQVLKSPEIQSLNKPPDPKNIAVIAMQKQKHIEQKTNSSKRGAGNCRP